MFRPLWAILRWVLKQLQKLKILAYVNGSVGYVAIVSLVVQTWQLHMGECVVGCYVLGVNIHLNLNFIAYRDAVTGLTYIVYIIYMYATQQDAPHRNEALIHSEYEFLTDLISFCGKFLTA
jgi:hypothetical protein